MSVIELVMLLSILLAALSIVWYSLKTGISPMVSSHKACETMLNSIDSKNEGSIIDLGSGWGTLVIAAACKNPNKQVVGYELSWLPWLISIIRKYRLGLDNLTIYRKDFNKAELNKFSIIFCYLFPQGMTALYEKLKLEQLSKIVVVSNTFALASCQATKVVKLNDAYRTPIYVYHWDPAKSRSIECD